MTGDDVNGWPDDTVRLISPNNVDWLSVFNLTRSFGVWWEIEADKTFCVQPVHVYIGFDLVNALCELVTTPALLYSAPSIHSNMDRLFACSSLV